MAIPIVVWIRFVLTVAFGTVAFGLACLTTPAVAGNQDLVQLVQMLETGDELTCEQALTELVPLGPQGSVAVDAICRHLGARSLLLCAMASDALVAIGSESVEPLKQHLGDTSPVVRATAVQTLGRLKAVSLETLAKFVDDPDARVRASVAIAIGHSEYENIAGLISELLRDDEPAVLVQACRVLKSNPVSPTEMVPALIKALSKTPTSVVVMETLSIYGTDAQSAIPELIARASEIENQIRSYRDLSFAKMLARIGPPNQTDSNTLGRWLGTSDPEKTGIIAETLARMKVADVSISNRLEQLTHELLDQGLLIEPKYAEADWEIQDEFDNSIDYFFAAEECAAAYWNVTHDSVRFIDLVERIARETEYPAYIYSSDDLQLASPWRSFAETDVDAISKLRKR